MPPLLLSRKFAPLFFCQFFAAFNDNFLKTALVFLILFRRGGTDAPALITLAGAVFIAPYFFLSALGGELADRHDKARVAQWLKFAEVFIAALAVFAFVRQSVPLLFATLAGFGVIAALFGPIKYGILPDHLRSEQLPAGNAFVEGATFIAILTGTLTGGLASRGGGDTAFFAVLLIGFALACWLSSLMIPPTGEGAPRLKVSANVAASTVAMIRHLWREHRLWWGAMVTSWFWLVGIVVLSLLGPLIKDSIGGNEDTATVYLAIFSVAVGVGSWLAAAFSRGRIVLAITVAGAVLLGIFSLDLGIGVWDLPPEIELRGPSQIFDAYAGVRAAFDLVGIAIGGGLFIVPAFAAVQAWSDPGYRARNVAAVNIINAGGMTVGTVVTALLQKMGATVPVLFLVIGAATLVVAAGIWRTLPRVR
jgi:acyl-[acyl-carrier-protein]-phospholipid O-acyltransferase/long-chain-fatty-acid--[acyl-carrier-protein] ligase